MSRGREVADALDLDGVDDGLEDLLPRRVLVADRHQNRLVLAVLVRLVAEADRGRLAAPAQLVGEDRRVEVEDLHGGGNPIGPEASRDRASAAISRSPACVSSRAACSSAIQRASSISWSTCVSGSPAVVAEQEERDDLDDPPAVALVPVAHVAEAARRRARATPGLLAHLAQGGLLRGLVAVRVALGQRQHLRAVRGAPRRARSRRTRGPSGPSRTTTPPAENSRSAPERRRRGRAASHQYT